MGNDRLKQISRNLSTLLVKEAQQLFWNIDEFAKVSDVALLYNIQNWGASRKPHRITAYELEMAATMSIREDGTHRFQMCSYPDGVYIRKTFNEQKLRPRGS